VSIVLRERPAADRRAVILSDLQVQIVSSGFLHAALLLTPCPLVATHNCKYASSTGAARRTLLVVLTAFALFLVSFEHLSAAAGLPPAVASPNTSSSAGSLGSTGLPSIVSNATPTELRTVDGLLVGLSRSVAVRDASAMRILQLDQGERAYITLASTDDFTS
jgi:hypothetical protein